MDERPHLTETITVGRCGSGFYTIDPEGTYENFQALKVRYGHRICSPFPFWACMLFLIYNGKIVKENALDVIQVRWLYPVYYSLLFLCIIHYLITHFKNPGVLPWNWAETQKMSYTSAEMRNGIASRVEQFEWAQRHPIPARAAFSRRWGFWILRGDHDCFWVTNWIGIGNHRYFVSATIFGTLLFALTIGITIDVVVRAWDAVPRKRCFTITSLVMGYISLVNLNQMLVQCRNITRNDTTYEKIVVKSDPDAPSEWDRGCWKNWEEVCGPRKFLLCWLLPVPLPMEQDGFSFTHEIGENTPFL